MDLTLKFRTADLGGKKLVVFEELFDAETKNFITDHKDKDDKAQSVDVSTHVKTGDKAPIVLLFIVMLSSLGTFIFMTIRRRKNK